MGVVAWLGWLGKAARQVPRPSSVSDPGWTDPAASWVEPELVEVEVAAIPAPRPKNASTLNAPATRRERPAGRGG
ncbi:MAG: hypothetical protein ACM3WR_12955 [Solirubrobacterales bacterium]